MTRDRPTGSLSLLPPDSLPGAASQPPGLSVIPGCAGEARLSPLSIPQRDPRSNFAGESALLASNDSLSSP